MPRVNMISEHVAILVAEELLSQSLIHESMISSRRELVDSIIAAGQVEIGAPYIPKGHYGDWFEDDPEEERVVSPAERDLAETLIRLVRQSENG